MINIQVLSSSDVKAAQRLRYLLNQNSEIQIGSEVVPLSSSLVAMMLEVLNQAVKSEQETTLTTTETAELLNVSRPYVVRLLETGKLPFLMVGTHRRVQLEDALTYKQKQRQKSLEIMQELAAEAQELGLGY